MPRQRARRLGMREGVALFKRRKASGGNEEPLLDFNLGSCGWLLAALMFLSGYVKREPAPFDLVLVMAIGFWAMTGAFVRGKRLMWLLFALAPYAATQLTGMIVSHDPLKSLSVGVVTLYLIAIVPALASLAGNPRWQVPKAMYVGLLISGVVFSVVSTLAYLGMFPMAWRWILHKRAAGGFKDPNVFAAWLIPAFLYAVSSALDTKGRRSIAYAVCGGVMGMALLVAFSRGAWGQCALTLIVVYVLQVLTPDPAGGRRKPRPGLWIFVGLMALLIAAYLGTNEAFVDLWEVRFGKQDYDQERFSAHDRGWELGISSMFGLGPGRVNAVVGMNVHNNYLHVLLEGGWISLLGYCVFLIASIARATWMALAAPNAEDRLFFRVAAASLIGLAVESWIIDIYHWRHLWYMGAIAWFPIRVSERKLREEKDYPPIYMAARRALPKLRPTAAASGRRGPSSAREE